MEMERMEKSCRKLIYCNEIKCTAWMQLFIDVEVGCSVAEIQYVTIFLSIALQNRKNNQASILLKCRD